MNIKYFLDENSTNSLTKSFVNLSRHVIHISQMNGTEESLQTKRRMSRTVPKLGGKFFKQISSNRIKTMGFSFKLCIVNNNKAHNTWSHSL